MRAWGAISALAALTIACGPTLQPLDDSEIEQPELLVDTSQLGPDFTSRQMVEATFGERTAIFQAILQKAGNQLTVVALTPQGQRAFVLTQRGRQVSVEKYPGVDLPFSAWHILVDIHRSLFRGGGPTIAPRADGDHRIEHPLEPMVETWRAGAVTKRVIDAHGKPHAILIHYEPRKAGPLYARQITYRNTRVGYTLRITPL